jgi:hypothetical protein
MEGLTECEFPQTKSHNALTLSLEALWAVLHKAESRTSEDTRNVRYVSAGERRVVRVEAVQSRTDNKKQYERQC